MYLERPPWSDAEGLVECTKDHYKLPSEEWEWEGDWVVIKDNTVDDEGWEYALQFRKKFHKVQNAFDFARRRRWTRKCVKRVVIPAFSVSTADDPRNSFANSHHISRSMSSVDGLTCDEELSSRGESGIKVRETLPIHTMKMLK